MPSDALARPRANRRNPDVHRQIPQRRLQRRPAHRKLIHLSLAGILMFASTLGLSIASLTASAPLAAADPFSSPQAYSTQADSQITELEGTVLGIGPDLVVTRTVSSANSVGESAANVRIIEGSITGTGITIPIDSADQSAPPDNTTADTGGIADFGVPGILTMTALSGNALARGFATACPPASATPQNDPDPAFTDFLDDFVLQPGDPPLFPTDARMLSRGIGEMGGLTLGGVDIPLIGEVTIFDAEAFTTVDASMLVPTGGAGVDQYGVRSVSTAETAGLDLLAVPILFPDGAIRLTWGGFNPYVSAQANGVPGGASTEFALPALQVQGPDGDIITLNPGTPPLEIGVPGIGTVTLTVGNPTQNDVSADGTHAEITVPLLSIDIELLFGLATMHFDILPMHAVADMAAGTTPGLQCTAAVDTMTPVEGPTSGGTTVTITGDNFAQGATTVTIGGITVPATVADDGQSLTFVTPPHAEGPVDVVVNTPDGSSPPQTFTYIPVPPLITGPADGTSTSDTTPPISGTGYPGSTIDVTDEDGNPVCTATVAGDGTWTCTPATPMDPGDHTITATQTSPDGDVQTSPPIDFTIIPAPVITGPADGGSTADPTPDVTGTGFPGSTITVEEGGTPICTATVAGDGTWTCTPTTPLTPGDHTITATQVAPDGNTQTSDPVTFTVLDASMTLAKTGGAVNDLDGNGTDAGDTVTYTFEVANTGTVAIDNPEVSDPQISPTPIPCGPASLAPAATATCTADYVLTQADVDAGSVENTATVSGTVDGTPVTAPGTTTTPIPGATAEFTTTKTGVLNDTNGNGSANTGETVDYTIVATNTGGVSITNVVVTDPNLPTLTCTPASGSDLAPTEAMTCTGTYTVTQADVDSGSVDNTATATGTNPADPAAPPVTGPGTSNIPTDQTGALTTTKTGALNDGNGNALADVGETIDYTITTTSTGADTVLDVEVTDPKIGTLTCTPATGADLAPGAAMTCTGTYTVTQADVDSGSVSNSATATGTLPGGGAPTSPGATSEVPTDTAGELTTAKTGTLNDADGNGLANAGETVDYTITATNSGPVTMQGVQVADPNLPTLTCTPALGADLAPTEVMTCTGTYTVTQADVDAGSVDNTATATGTNPADPTGPPVTGPGTSTIPADATGELTTTKAGTLNDGNGNALADVGETIDYTITSTNTGAVTVSDVQVSDPKIPTLTCTPALGSALAPTEAMVCTGSYTVTQADVDSGSVSNSAVATGTLPDGGTPTSPGGTSELPTDSSGELTIVKTGTLNDLDGNALADVGETIDYTITTTSTGAVSVQDVQVSDPRIPTLACTPALGSDLAPGEAMVCTGSYTVTQADIDAGSVDNTATATGTNPTDPTGPPVDGGGGSSIPANTTGELTTTKTGDLDDTNANGFADVGETIDYTITTTSTGAVTVLDVQVTDLKIGALTCTPAAGADLAPGDAMTCTGSYAVTQADVDSGAVSNVATATGTLPDGGTPTSPGGTSEVPTDTTGELTTTKTGALNDGNGNAVADVGETVDYTITATNTGAVTVGAVQVSDPKIPTLSCTPALGSDVAPGEAMVCTGSYTVTQADLDSGSVENTATATGTNPTDPDAPPIDGGGGTTIPSNTTGELTTVKTGVLNDSDGNGVAAVGETIDYTITATNTGAVALTDVQVSDPKIPTLTCTPALGSPLAVGEVMTCTGTYAVTQADVDSGSVDNTAIATGTNPTDPTDPPVDGGGGTTVPTDTTGELTTTKTGVIDDTNGNDVADVDEVINYTITLTNTGAVTVSNVQVADPKIPTLTCSPALGASLAAGEAMSCSGDYVVTQADIDAGSVSNSATATGTMPDGSTPTSPGGTTEVPTNTTGELTIVKTGELNDADGNGLANPGETVDYTIVTTNTGAVTVGNVQVTDPRLTSLTCTLALGGDLAPGDAITCTGSYVVTQADIDAGAVENTAAATGTNPTDPDGPPIDGGGGGSSVPTESVADLTTTKTGTHNDANDNGLADVGETIDYSITTTNTGTVTLTDVTVVDTKLADAGVALTCTPGQGVSLAADESITCTATYTVTQADIDAGGVHNSATATATDPSNPGTPPNTTPGGNTVPTDTEGALSVTKTGVLNDADGDQFADLGETIDYTVTVTNIGAPTAVDVAVSDPLITDSGGAFDCRVDGTQVVNGEFDLGPGQAAICTASYEVTAADIAAGSVLNTATASAANPADPESPGTEAAGSVTTPIEGAPTQPSPSPTQPPQPPPPPPIDRIPDTGGPGFGPLLAGLLALGLGGIGLLVGRLRESRR